MSINLWTASLRRLLSDLGLGGATWRRTRASGAAPGSAAQVAHTSGAAIFFLSNGQLQQQLGLPHMPLFEAAYWGLCASSTDVQAGDIYDNGAIAFLITGDPDRLQGFLLAPADRAGVPS